MANHCPFLFGIDLYPFILDFNHYSFRLSFLILVDQYQKVGGNYQLGSAYGDELHLFKNKMKASDGSSLKILWTAKVLLGKIEMMFAFLEMTV